MRSFTSNKEFFAFVYSIADRLKAEGNLSASARLLEGMSCLNGLTDGWATLLACVDAVLESSDKRPGVEVEADLREAQAVIKAMVYGQGRA